MLRTRRQVSGKIDELPSASPPLNWEGDNPRWLGVESELSDCCSAHSMESGEERVSGVVGTVEAMSCCVLSLELSTGEVVGPIAPRCGERDYNEFASLPRLLVLARPASSQGFYFSTYQDLSMVITADVEE
ncbi:hypothetical protein SAMD00023353_2401300 [Rosellinia necatrix]|uniref:Uncharacterized protein n=1 Tax=Rosellinia necatrix TaxID=77044 RepID=A0A1S8A835_ROSNE|nr:hypothetical protein SAMD00023353_2401300 [Rosellinia necatrix]